jgi:L-iditol 2-dehydrogenase
MPRQLRLDAARSLTRGRGFDIVIEASGHPDAVSEALDIVRDGGRVVVCGHYTDNGSVEIHPHWQINRKHVELRGCWGSRYEHFHRAVEIAARFGDTKPWSAMAGQSYALSDVGSALEAVANRSLVKAVVRVQ